ncbi:hypothetical protein BATDEDRAFT_86940 [Batrachochytrium dendrobatidis JAM81]|uniref:Protein BFR2 n=2 Tax=Batrachochytrium dendrobatidis TaxID=109871 RepID=F4NXR0_BATDJ|nr:rRNA-processing protein BFR2 [Batrachochytrium dendrobatidis JAM81]EGF81891.1 hypothetical protein BATDEDRAFT_86940 [Batrachochytrium dendrobatidis JAM81]KAJ8324536.1 rRNA-processing protein bfr2 [Batrachochytrium dendrobatidis]KAK5670783.1 rRNA-processing protein bfr2 [Batrachochytrium dendrobatidis]OAJ40545.1 hypothetical protein BDEG_24264 [Batrachochytrium dendrobatidis JEL423]|eukprot:XP_006677567.1 hypothetical protein BATDEDRAFT_86940 [Batrachochytrium dendrobatidis JAM81]
MPVEQRSRPKKTLGERIAELANPRPYDFDPENTGNDALAEAEDSGRLSDMNNESEDDAARNHYASVTRSSLRDQLDLDMDDPKYLGKRVTRKALEQEESNEDSNDSSDKSELGETEISSDDEQSAESQTDGFEDESDRNSSSDADDQDSGETMMATLARLQKDQGKMMKAMTESAQADVEKGKHVRAQLGLWDSLLDIRIRIQKAVDLANQMPQASMYEQFLESATQEISAAECRQQVKETSAQLTTLLDDLTTLRLELVDRNPAITIDGIKDISHKRSYLSLESSDQDSIQHIWDDVLAPFDNGFLTFRDETINKWNNKVQAASGIHLHKKFKALDQSVVSQIQQISHDRDRLVKRTHLIRTPLTILGKKENPDAEDLSLHTSSEVELRDKHLSNYDPEIFDDGDYYQQLLKELIESRMSDANDPAMLGAKFAQLKQMQNKRGKKAIDTKASKGRKVRYHVHEKIQNFMASEPRGTWHDEMASELFSSLFGRKIKDANYDATDDQVEEQSHEVSAITATDGFKILG